MVAPDASPAARASALRPPRGPRTIVLVVGPIARAAVPGLCERVRVLLQGREVDAVTCDVAGLGCPDAVALDALARLQLTAQRLGRSIRVRHARDELEDLLALVGLRVVLPLCDGLPLEPRGQIEEREEVRLDEEVDPDDPPS